MVCTFEIHQVAPGLLHEIRRKVLRGGDPDASVVDPRDDEPTALHFAGLLGSRVVVSASFYPTTAPMAPDFVGYQLRYMATEPDVQGVGYAARVLATAEVELRRLGAQIIWANGRDSALGFYRSTGWRTIAGSEHLSAETRLPHTVIYKGLAPVNERK